MTTRLWYAAYGSNLSAERFSYYISGGRPAGGTYTYQGCRDRTEPVEHATMDLTRELVFGGTSQTWNGGVAFLDPDRDSLTKSRLYLITADQFDDVLAQENWMEPGMLSVDTSDRAEISLDEVPTYALVLRVGVLDTTPVLTFTKRRGTQVAKPSSAYLRYVAAGLAEAFSWSPSEIAGYLASKPGIADELTTEELESILS